MLGRAPRPSEAYSLTIMAVRALLPAYDAQSTPLAELVPPLELALFGRQPLLAAAAGEAGATAASIVTSLIRHVQNLRASAPGAGSSSGGGATGAASAPHDAIEEALTGSAFLTFKAAVSAADFLTAGGRRTDFEAATVGDCILPTCPSASSRWARSGSPSATPRSARCSLCAHSSPTGTRTASPSS